MGRKCFVIMSFAHEYDAVYHQAIRPAVNNCGYECVRADEDKGPGNIPSKIVESIIDSELIIADLSSDSPNVHYEICISHAVGNKTISITSDINNLPFDVKVFRVLQYSNDKKSLDLLRYDIEAAISKLENNPSDRPNNLVQESGRDFFDVKRSIQRNLDEIIKQRRRTEAFSDFVDLKGEQQNNIDVANEIVEHLSRVKVSHGGWGLLVSITGPGAIGKSTFAALLAKQIRKLHDGRWSVDILPTDSYQLPRVERIHRNLIGFDPRSHNLSKLTDDVECLLNGSPVTVAPYDHLTGAHSEMRTVHPSDFLILEGVYAFYPCVIPLNKGLKYYIFANKHQAKELKFIADFRDRGYDVQTAFSNSENEYSAYETHILPFLKFADYVINVDEYWKYEIPKPQDFPLVHAP